MEIIHLNIAGIQMELRMEFPVGISEDYAPFLTEERPPEEIMEFSRIAEFPPIRMPERWEHGCGISEWNGYRVIFSRLTEENGPYVMEVQISDSERDYYYREFSPQIPDRLFKIFNDIGLEEILKRHGAMILHSSLVRWQGKAILFSAPSGTGKSTQADLWETYMGSETLNGDRSGLRKIDGVWVAHGLPYAGSSGIYRNESAPIAAIVMLSQGPENVIEPLRPAQCLRKIFPEVTLHRWDPEFMDWGISQITDLVSSVPCYHLSCRPDRGAVELLRETIQREG